jgi:hypothetical protein
MQNLWRNRRDFIVLVRNRRALEHGAGVSADRILGDALPQARLMGC